MSYALLFLVGAIAGVVTERWAIPALRRELQAQGLA